MKTKTPSIIDLVLECAALDLRMFPCYGITSILNQCHCGKDCKTPGKHPRIKQWPQKATSDPEQILKWWRKWDDANWATATGAGIVAIDVDNRDGRDGIAMLAKLQKEHGALPPDWMVKTGGGGQHMYFSVPVDSRFRDVDRFKDDGIELKADGRYVIAPPSRHASGELYRWISRKGRPPALPSGWLSLFTTAESAEPATPLGDGIHNWFRRTNEDQKPEEQIEELKATNTDNTDKTELVSVLSVLSVLPPVHSEILRIIDLTYPRVTGTRNKKLIELGRHLLRLDELKGKDAEDFEPVIRLWLSRAKPYIDVRDFDATMSEWMYIWSQWLKDDISSNPVYKAHELMQSKPLPPIPPEGYRSSAARKLVALCAAMAQGAADSDGVFYLSCRVAAGVLGLDPVKNYQLVSLMLRQMVKDGMLEVVGERKQGSMRANRYKYREYQPSTVLAA